MSPTANVRAIHTLEELKGALGRFGGEARGALQAAEQEIRRTLDWLQERHNYWRSEVRRRREEVRQAEADLDSCLASGYDDEDGRYHAPNCSAEEHALHQAQVRLREAEEELQNVRRWMKVVGEAVDTYRVQAQRLSRLIAADLPKANAFLERKIAELERYRALRLAATPLVGQAGLSSPQKGTIGEEWARTHVFGGKKTRITVRPEDNPHLARQDDAGLGLHRRRTSDHFIDADGALWDVKFYGPDSTIDPEQLADYNMMADAGYVVDIKGVRHNVTSVNYLFLGKAAAEKNYELLNLESVLVWYVDDAGIVRCLQQEL